MHDTIFGVTCAHVVFPLLKVANDEDIKKFKESDDNEHVSNYKLSS